MANDTGARLRAAQGYAELGMVSAAWRELNASGDEIQRRLDPDAIQTEIVLLIKEERWQEGFQRSELLCELSPESLIGFVHGAFCLHELKRTGEALEFLRSGPPALRKEAVFHYNSACYRSVLGKLKSARRSLMKACNLDPKFGQAAKSDPDLEALRKAAEED